jgi:hypothetical protein
MCLAGCWLSGPQAGAARLQVCGCDGRLGGCGRRRARAFGDVRQISGAGDPGRGAGPASDMSAGAALGPPAIRLVAPGWEDIGLGAITDIVQHAFGPVGLDRSPVELAAGGSHPGCPACGGRRFGFPGDLAEARAGMCPDHRREAEALIDRRRARANASDPDGWGALAKTTVRLGYPHLPNGLASRLVGADQAMYVIPEPDELAERAKLVIDAASWFPGQPDVLAVALGQEPDVADQLPDWLVSLVLDLGRAGLGPEAADVGRALAQVDPDRPSSTRRSGSRWLRLVLPTRPELRSRRIWLAGQTISGSGFTQVTRWPRSATSTGRSRISVVPWEWLKTPTTSKLATTRRALDRLRRLGRSRRRRDGAARPVGQRRQSTRKLSKSQRKRRSRRKR